MKKFLRILNVLVIAFVIILLCACNKSNTTVKSKKNPMVSNDAAAVASVVKDGKTLEVSNAEAYLNMKVNNGATELVSLVDEYLLSDYLAKVTNDDLKAAVDKEVFGTAELTDEEKEEKQNDFLEKIFVSLGINATSIYDEAVLNAYKLSVAQKLYAKEVLLKTIKETDEKYEAYEKMTDEEKKNAENPTTAPYFADSKYQTKYNKDHVNKYSVILVTFPTNRQANVALQAIGVKVEDGKWVKADGSALSNDEIFNKYVELYKYAYGYKTGEFNKDSEEFDYTETELSSVNPTTLARVKNKMVTMDKAEEGTWYIASPFEAGSGSLFVFALKIDEELVTSYDDLTDDEKKAAKETYFDALVDDALTSQYINIRLAELRKEKNFKIYDTVMEKDYEDVVLNYNVEYTATTEEKTDVVASVDGKEFKADELYAKLLAKYGVATVSELLTNKYLLNSEFNTYYKDGKWLDESKKADFEQLVEAEKTNFKNGSYSNYGFTTDTASWETFIEASYSVRNDEELLMYFLLDQVSKDYTSKLNTVVDKDLDEATVEASSLWTKMKATMEKTQSEYFSVKGIHLLISSYKSTTDYISGASPLDPEEWTEEQRVKATELAGEVVAYLKEETGTYQSRLEKIVDAFKSCPNKDGEYTFNGKAVNTKLVSGNGNATINVSLYKGYGLYVKYESLGTFTNGKMVTEFNDAVKALYDKEVTNNHYGTTNSQVALLEEPIKTVYGYHVYINLQVTDLKYAERTEIKVMDPDKGEEVGSGEYNYRFLPTLAEIRTYAQDNSSSALSTNVKTAITTYYSPINSELTGTYFTLAKRYHELVGLTLTSSVLKSDDFAKYVTYYEKYVIETNLKYVTVDYLD